MTEVFFILGGICAFILGVAVMAMVKYGAREEMERELMMLKSFLDEMGTDWLLLYAARNDFDRNERAIELAQKWVGSRGKLDFENN